MPPVTIDPLLERGAQLCIGGEWVSPASQAVIGLIRPATEGRLGEVAEAGAADVDRAVIAARRAFDTSGWASAPVAERCVAVERLADALEARARRMAQLCTDEVGTPLSFSQLVNAVSPVAILRYHAGLGRTLETEELRSGPTGRTAVRRVPVGVVAVIVPWNYPQGLLSFKVAPALVAGCAMVVKPSPETSFDALLFAEAVAEAGIPAGVVNVVTGGAATGELLIRHPGVDKVSFTGSTAAGRRIAEICGAALTPVTLELGGKSAAILLEDADLAGAMQGLAFASFANSGQSCFACTRVLAPRGRYEEVVEALTALAASLRVGDPDDPETMIGPLVTARQRQRVEDYIAIGRLEGAVVTTGGGRPQGLDRGWYISPTVFRDADNSMRVAREEIFAPVVAAIAYDGEDQAVAIANDSEYGLAGTVWSSDVERATAVARRIETGSIGVNGYSMDFAAPFGGWKASGLGRELGPEGLEEYLRTQSVYLPG